MSKNINVVSRVTWDKIGKVYCSGIRLSKPVPNVRRLLSMSIASSNVLNTRR